MRHGIFDGIEGNFVWRDWDMRGSAKVVVIMLGIIVVFGSSIVKGDDGLVVTTRRRVETLKDSDAFGIVTEEAVWKPSGTAIIVCDMWNRHHCISAERRVAEMAPYMNDVLKDARDKGVFIIHAPSGCMQFYESTPQRKRAQEAPYAKAPAKFGWNRREQNREGPMPVRAGCSCDSPKPCAPSRAVWTRQIDTIGIAAQDAFSDNGQEVYNLLAQRGIENVVLMGVHTNICVLGRPFGLRQMVKFGKNVVLCRDLTDSYHRGPGKHFEGLGLVIEHIEKFICPTITSTVFTRRPQFRFNNDKRTCVVFVIADDEYDAAKTLPEFARQLEDKYNFCCEFALARAKGGNTAERNRICHMEALMSADLAIVYVRRRALPPKQMKYLRDYVAGGKPVIGLRTASHAFSLRRQKPPAGYVDWPEFDQQVLGGNYHGHHGNKSKEGPQTYVWVKPGMESHPILAGVPGGEVHVRSWLYKTLPLTDTTAVLMMGRVEDREPHEPVAWTNITAAGGRVFYTSLGHPDDFKLDVFRRMLTNAVFWALARPVPE